MIPNKARIKSELLEHLPFTAFGAAMGIILLAVIESIFLQRGLSGRERIQDFFHIFHALHILLSGLTSTAVAFRIGHHPSRAMLIGFLTTLPFCVISDMLLPYVGGLIVQAPMHFHLCAIQEPLLVFPFLFFGIIVGLLSERKIGRVSYLSHGSHVLVSSFASLFYLVSYGLENWLQMLGAVFLITFFAVIIPCCLSDIIFPVSFTHAEHEHPHS